MEGLSLKFGHFAFLFLGNISKKFMETTYNSVKYIRIKCKNSHKF